MGAPAAVRRRAARVLARVSLIRVDEPVLAAAARPRPVELRTLDAIHLGTATSLDELAGLVTYDARLARAAHRARIRVWSPA
jgi:predicted nucleic acid-binding protein